MKKAMEYSAIATALAFAVVFFFSPRAKNGAVLSLLITLGVFLYHISMRLLVGSVIRRAKLNYHPDKRHWHLLPFEKKFYRAIRVKAWKKHMPTYDEDAFNIRKHTIDGIIASTCEAETVHASIMVLSWLPLLLAIPYGSFSVFFITSLVSCLIDFPFLIMQRYNRERLIRVRNINNRRK